MAMNGVAKQYNAGRMTLHFLSKTVSLDGRSSEELRVHIENILHMEGVPVRWAVVEADENIGTCRVDAIVSRC